MTENEGQIRGKHFLNFIENDVTNNNLLCKMEEIDDLATHYSIKLSPAEAFYFFAHFKRDLYIAEMIYEINKIVPRTQFDGDNPNNGTVNHCFYVGKEGYRVVTLQIVKGYIPKDFDYEKLGEQLSKLSHNFEADEADIIVNETEPFIPNRITGYFKYRFGWTDPR